MTDTNNSTVRYDLSGHETITAALLDLLNQYPGLKTDDEITFSALEESYGKTFYPISGAVIQSETTSVTGRVRQKCLYPFVVVYRVSAPTEAKRIEIKQWLDDVGKWLEGQEITVKEVSYKLTEYPTFADEQSFVSFQRQTPGYLEAINENQSEDWQIYITANYENIYKKQNIGG